MSLCRPVADSAWPETELVPSCHYPREARPILQPKPSSYALSVSRGFPPWDRLPLFPLRAVDDTGSLRAALRGSDSGLPPKYYSPKSHSKVLVVRRGSGAHTTSHDFTPGTRARVRTGSIGHWAQRQGFCVPLLKLLGRYADNSFSDEAATKKLWG